MQNYPFLLEVRIGHARDRVAGPIKEVKSVFRLRSESPTVPHMTLYGPFRLKPGYTIGDLRYAIESSVQEYAELTYKINGWDYKTGQNGGVIAYKVEVSREMQNCHRVLWDSLQRLTDPKYPWDNNPKDMWFHITLAYHLKDRKFRGIKRYLNIDQELSGNFFSRILDRVLYGRIFKKTAKTPANPVILPHRGLRITILHHRVIAAEYDLVLKRWLNRSEAKSERVWGQTLQGYRRKNGIQKTKPEYRSEQTIFVIGDLHLGHTNIIRYCCRPFLSSTIQEMDNVLINNWNFTVKQNDTVLFLGDLTYRGGTNPHYYLSKLHGCSIPK